MPRTIKSESIFMGDYFIHISPNGQLTVRPKVNYNLADGNRGRVKIRSCNCFLVRIELDTPKEARDGQSG